MQGIYGRRWGVDLPPNLLFSFELCLVGEVGGGSVDAEASCYFLLNYANNSCLTQPSQMLQVVSISLLFSFELCLWLLSCAGCRPRPGNLLFSFELCLWTMVGASNEVPSEDLLFSFELCALSKELNETKNVLAACYFLLNYASGSGSCLEAQIIVVEAPSLLFSFELCLRRERNLDTALLHSSCYFLLNYALFDELLNLRESGGTRLAIFFWIMQS